MIQFLKESTFAANDVIRQSWRMLRAHYFSIAGLCASLFITSNASGLLAFYLQDVSPVWGVLMAILFVIVYFGIQLTLFKYIFRLIDQEEKINLSQTLPSTIELSRYFLAMFYVGMLMLSFYLLLALLAWPLIYWVGVDRVVNGTYVLSAAVTLYFLVRVAFYPFFIIDRHSKSFHAIRLSIALTRGNVLRLLLILGFFAILHLLFIYFNYLGYPGVSIALSVLNSFLIVPLSSVVVATAYREMIKNYG